MFHGVVHFYVLASAKETILRVFGKFFAFWAQKFVLAAKFL
jgi:hypothetical protein